MDASLATGLRVFVAYVVLQYVLKRIVGRDRRTERFLHQFVFAFGIAALVALIAGDVRVNAAFAIVAAIGFIAAGGTYLAWKAIALSQSRNALFTFWDDAIAMGLSVWILREGQFISPVIGIGIGLSFLSLLLFVRFSWRQKDAKEKRSVPLRFYGYVLTYSISWGVAVFGQRYWSFHDMPVQTFVLAWYVGTLIAALLIYLLYTDPGDDQRARTPFTAKDIGAHFFLALLIYVSLVLASFAYRAPVVVVQPVFLVAEMIIPALMGLYVFHERKQFAPEEWAYFAIGFAGALLVANGL